MKKNFGLRNLRNPFSRISRPGRKFQKNREISRIRAVRPGMLRKPSQTYFLEFRTSLRSKWVIYQPRTTISEDFIFWWSSTIFRGFPGNRVFVDLQNHDIAEGKLLKSKKIILCRFVLLELFIWSLRRWNLGFWVIHMVKTNFSAVWNLRSRFFHNFWKIMISNPKPWHFAKIYGVKIYFW